MVKFIKYYFFFFLILFYSSFVKAQYLCEYELKVVTKQKRKVRKLAEVQVKEWYAKNSFGLKLPPKLKFIKIGIKNEQNSDELKQWDAIDSILCVNKGVEFRDQAFKKMSEIKLPVYEIKAYFNFDNSTNKEIRSLLYFNFNINGNLLVTVIREKEDSPYSETYYH